MSAGESDIQLTLRRIFDLECEYAPQTTTQLCKRVYKTRGVTRSQRNSIKRAMQGLMSDSFCFVESMPSSGRGGELIFYRSDHPQAVKAAKRLACAKA
jgi:hypothetical protein